MAMSVLCTAFLGLHLILQPYKKPLNNRMEAVLLGILCILSFSEAGTSGPPSMPLIEILFPYSPVSPH